MQREVNGLFTKRDAIAHEIVGYVESRLRQGLAIEPDNPFLTTRLADFAEAGQEIGAALGREEASEDRHGPAGKVTAPSTAS